MFTIQCDQIGLFFAILVKIGLFMTVWAPSSCKKHKNKVS